MRIVVETVDTVHIVDSGVQGPPGRNGRDAVSLGDLLLFSRRNEDYSTLARGQAVFAYSSTGVRKAVANESSAAWRVIGLATETITQNSGGMFQAEGVMVSTVAEWDAVTGEVGGLVPGRNYFLHPTDIGRITQVPPSGDGEYLCRIGTAHSPTELYLDIGSCIKL